MNNSMTNTPEMNYPNNIPSNTCEMKNIKNGNYFLGHSKKTIR